MEASQFLIELEDDDLSWVTADDDGIFESLSEWGFTPWYLKATAVLSTQNSSSIINSSSLPLNRWRCTDLRQSKARSIWFSLARFPAPWGKWNCRKGFWWLRWMGWVGGYRAAFIRDKDIWAPEAKIINKYQHMKLKWSENQRTALSFYLLALLAEGLTKLLVSKRIRIILAVLIVQKKSIGTYTTVNNIFSLL